MRPRRPPNRIAKPSQRSQKRLEAGLPDVPTFQPDPAAAEPRRSPSAVADSSAAEDHAADEAVRRMVEAAYT